jgi:polysaccharide pyruvyl transferase CsaB
MHSRAGKVPGSMNDNGTPRVGISGSYGGLNLGDEAILQAIIAQLRRSISVSITVFSRNAEDTRRRHDIDRVVEPRGLSRREAQREVGSLDALLLGGGGILYDADAEGYLREVRLAREAGVPVMLYAVSAGPLKQPAVRSLVRDALEQMAVITVRDRHSRHLLEEIGVQHEIMVTADPALLLQVEPLTVDDLFRAEAIEPGTRLIGLSVREPGPAAPDLDIEHYYRLVASAADFMIDRLDAEVVFFPLERNNRDVQHSHGVVARMRHAQRATVLKREYTPGQVIALLQHFDFALGMRLHFLIFSALADLPFVALPYASKVDGFLEAMQLDNPGFEHISAGQFIASFDRAWQTRDALRERIHTSLRRLQASARLSNDLAIGLLTKREARPREEAKVRC